MTIIDEKTAYGIFLDSFRKIVPVDLFADYTDPDMDNYWFQVRDEFLEKHDMTADEFENSEYLINALDDACDQVIFELCC